MTLALPVGEDVVVLVCEADPVPVADAEPDRVGVSDCVREDVDEADADCDGEPVADDERLGVAA